MISRRVFAGCGICAAIGLVAENVSAQGTQAQGTTPAFTRKQLDKTGVGNTGYDTILMEITINPNAKVPRHTHPGTESGVVAEGEATLHIEGQSERVIRAGDTFFVTVGTPHSVDNGGKPTKVFSTYVVERDKPLASPA